MMRSVTSRQPTFMCWRARRPVRGKVQALASSSVTPFVIPSSPEAATKQAQDAVQAAYNKGVSRQRLDVLLPLIGATDLDDWPGGIRQQFKAALPMVETMLKTLRKELDMEGKLEAKVLDDGDAVGVWYNDAILVVLFPTGDTLPEIERLAQGKQLVVMVNPQWTGGQVISDFGIFGRKKKEAFVNTFKTTYSLQTKRMCGEDIRVLCMDDRAQVFVREVSGFTLVGEYPEVPEYKELEKILMAREGSIASMSIAERIRAEMAFNADSLQQPPKE